MPYNDKIKEYSISDNDKKIDIMKEWETKVKTLYRYRPINSEKKYSEETDALEKKDVYCSNFEKLNDPDEGIIIREILFNAPKNIASNLRKKLEKFRANYGVSCFSEIEPQGNDAENMWENYAGAGEGICIQYKVSDMIKNNFFIIPVTYVKSLKYKDLEYKGKSVADLTFATKHILGKNKEGQEKVWKKEREWRHIIELDNDNKEGKYSNVYLEPEKIYFGKKLNKQYKEKIREICPNIEIIEL